MTDAQQFNTFCQATQEPTDPFPAGDAFPLETVALCRIDLDEFGPPAATATLYNLDGCAYPSSSPTSAPTDCIVLDSCTTNAECDDANACTVDSCDPTELFCLHLPDPGIACDDGDACTQNETCNSLGFCTDGSAVDCDDAITCTIASCIEPTGACTHAASDSACDDGEFCTGAESCNAATGCTAGIPPACADGIDCTVDICDEAADVCRNSASDTLCSDGQHCNGEESCDASVGCTVGDAVIRDDGFACSSDRCDEFIEACAVDASACNCGDLQPGPGEHCDPPASAGGDPACGDDCLFICGNGIVADQVCMAGLVGAACETDADCDTRAKQGSCRQEECDPPRSETCNNFIDDDGDFLIDCADPDCETGGLSSCGVTCDVVAPCGCIARDPAFIKLRPAPRPDYFTIHGRILIDPDRIDPEALNFAVSLSKAQGAIYQAQVPADAILLNGTGRWSFQNKDAKKGIDDNAPYEGMSRLALKIRKFDKISFLTFKLKAYGDLARATTPKMTTQVYVNARVWSLTAEWAERPKGYMLTQALYPACEVSPL